MAAFMDPDAKPDPLAVRHRPLPSVDLALLPHELRAARTKIALAVGAVVLLVGAGAALSILQGNWEPGTGPEDAAETVTANAAPEPVPASDRSADPSAEPRTETAAFTNEPRNELGRTTTVRKFGSARGFRDALQHAGASVEESAELVTALEKHVDFRRCQPTHELVFEREGDGTLVNFEYRVGITEIYRARPDARGALVGSRVNIPIETRRVAVGGYVAASLGQALDALGLGRTLAGVFVESFEGRFDFKKATRAGDSFRILVDREYVNGELLRYGTVHAVEYQSEREGTLRAFWFQPPHGKGDYYDASGVAMHGGWLRTPLQYDHISSPYNPKRKHPILKRIMPHNGIDYAASPGTSVWAAATGKVTFAGNSGANGNLIAIRHANGYETFYAHLLRISSGVRAGAAVTQRQPIGAVGSTGRSTGPHLHFALKRHGHFINPASQLNGPGMPLPAGLMGAFRARVREAEAELKAITLADAPSGEDPEVAGTETFHDEGDLP